MNSKAIAGKKWNNKIKNTHKIQSFFFKWHERIHEKNWTNRISKVRW